MVAVPALDPVLAKRMKDCDEPCAVENTGPIYTVGRNTAVTLLLVDMATVQGPVPLQAPAHCLKPQPAGAAAVRVTDVPVVKDALQVSPQLMPDGAEVIVPMPLTTMLRIGVAGGVRYWCRRAT